MKEASKKCSESFLNELEQLKCPICHEIQQNVRELPCKHTFCSGCLEAYKEQNKVKQSIVCPLCKKKISKRKVLSCDAALDALGTFVKSLCEDIELQNGTEAMNYFKSAFSGNKFDSDEIIPRSSDENWIPSGSKHNLSGKKSKQRNHTGKKAAEVLRPKNEEPCPDEKKKKCKPKIGLTRKPQKNTSASIQNSTKPKTESLDQTDPHICQLFKNKKKILEWLNDTRNNFEKYSQTQQMNSQNLSTQDIDMPSVSQIHVQNRAKKNSINVTKSNVCPNKNKSFECRKTRSIFSSPTKNLRSLRRHSLECTSPMKVKKYQTLQEKNNIENHLNVMENEVLDVIDKELSGEKKNMTNQPTENIILNLMNIEDKILDQLENENFSTSVEAQKKGHSLDLSHSTTNKVQKSWKNIQKFKKTIGTVKAPKKLNISPQSNLKFNKNIESKSNKSEVSNIGKTQNKSVDYQAMEDYFSKTLPEMIQNNVVEQISENVEEALLERDTLKENDSIMCEQDIFHEDSTIKEKEPEDNESDIYVYQTQPLQGNICAPKIDKMHYALELTKKLENTLNQLIEEDKIQIQELEPLRPSIQNLFQILGSSFDISDFNTHKILENKKKVKVCEKEIQTDLKKFVMKDIAIQTDNQSFDLGEVREMTQSNCSTSQKRTNLCDQKNSPLKDLNNISKNIASMEEAPEINVSIEDKSQDQNENEKAIDKIADYSQTQKNTSKTSQMSRNVSKNAPNTPKLSDECSPGSGIIFSVPQVSSGVNRRLMFEKEIQENNGSPKIVKRLRSMDSGSDCDGEPPHKVKCNRLLQCDDLSIAFESDTQNHENVDVIMKEVHEDFSMGHEQSPDLNTQTNKKLSNSNNKNSGNNIVNYCDELIEKANKQILDTNMLPSNIQDSEEIPDKFNRRDDEFITNTNETVQAKEKIATQDLLKHYEELIEKASKNIENENNEEDKTSSQITNSKQDVQKTQFTLKTQDMLNHINSLIEKNSMEIADNEKSDNNSVCKINNVECEIDDEFFCGNLDQFDKVLEKEENRLEQKKYQLSESLFESEKRNESIMEKDKLLKTPLTDKSIRKNEKVKDNEKMKSKTTDPFCSSDDEIFSDDDVLDSTPQKSTSFIQRLSCSQLVDQNSKAPKSQAFNNFSESIMIVPPPPGFNDEMEIEENNLNENSPSIERESENVIPNSLSFSKFELPPKRKPQMNTVTPNVVQQELPISQQFMRFSPICKDKSTMETVRQSTFSPLIVKNKPSTPILTSTPKQKSILSYVKPKVASSQGSSTLKSEKRKPCIAFTRLNNAEILCVLSLCNKNLVTRQEKFGPEITHMVVSVDKQNYVKDHTIKFISAIAAGIWVVNIKWVQECLSQNGIVNEEPFEVFDITGIPSPRISRLTRLTNPLLKGFKCFIPRAFTQTSVEDVKNIIQLLQGVVVSSIDELKNSNGDIRIVICELIDTEDYTQYEEWLSLYKILTVDINWLSLSVSRYKLLSLRPHLLCSDDAIMELGYPTNLVEDVASTLTQDVTTYH